MTSLIKDIWVQIAPKIILYDWIFLDLEIKASVFVLSSANVYTKTEYLDETCRGQTPLQSKD